ncbi:uncharacterized protein LOC130818875 [Amaranthus tricolor]|uniref:uncharacterized protein LOC130818875 n=1 Tax=Amaranthus tricolor TaxID=29722 RepID=UPI00258E65E0|nr:uncharacterized protein LOC130818875 [Amaranthus tricolor]
MNSQLLRSNLTPIFQIPLPIQSHLPKSFPILSPIRCNNNNNNGINNTSENLEPPETVEIKFRRGSRKRQRQQNLNEDPMKKFGNEEVQVKKDWESMSLSEKAIELYMGEKGLLFWINKFAYASIFIVIGGWILFRFVGPSLNLYQLDTPPLAPDNMFKGS